MYGKVFKHVDVVSMDKGICIELDKLVVKSVIAFRVFNFFICNMDKSNTVQCSHRQLANKFDVSSRTATRVVKLLKDIGLISVNRYGTFNIYTVDKDIVFKSKRLMEVYND